jgi:hypothetical protein
MSIYTKINDVMKKVSYIKKDATIGTGNMAYKAVSHDAVVGLCRDHFRDVGIVVFPEQIEKGVSVEGTTKSGNAKIRFEALYNIHFVDIDDPLSRITVRVEAHSEDSGDKGAGKAVTYATKSAILKVLMLETGEDEEGEKANTINAKQEALIAQLITDSDTDIVRFFAAYSITKLSDLPETLFTKAQKQLQDKLKAKNENKPTNS